MKKRITHFIIFIIAGIASISVNAQCPADPSVSATCTSTISSPSAANVTVTSGMVVCLTSGAQTGTFTVQSGGLLIVSGGSIGPQVAVQSGGSLVASGGVLNNSASLPSGASMYINNTPTLGGTMSMSGGTLNVLSGGTFSKDVSSGSPSGVINNCGTISGSRNFGPSITLNNYSTSNLTLSTGGNTLNNYANNVTIAYGNVNTSNTLNNYGTGVNFSITSSWNSGMTFNNALGAVFNVTSVPGQIPSSTVFNNAGTFTYTPTVNTNGATFNNATTGNFTFVSAASANSAVITNNGTMSVTGDYYLAGGSITNNGNISVSGQLRVDGGTLNINANSTATVNNLYKNNGTINMGDHSLLNITQNITNYNGTPINLTSGCASIIASTTPSTSGINSTLLNNTNLNFCGSAPAQAPATIPITSVSNNGSGAYRITMSSGPATNGYVQISGVTGVSNLNGYWKVIQINSTTFDLIGSTYTAGAVFSSSQVIIDQTKLKLGTSTYLGYSGCTNPCAPLPIKLVSFNAYKEDGNVKIVWQTIEEKNNQYYVIEKSTDGINYQTVTTIDGNRNSTRLLTYTEYDFTPYAGISYYRLKQIDYDGTYTYSSIAVVNFDGNTEWTVFPNPSVDGSFTIRSNFSEDDIMSVTVTDVTGNRVRYYADSDYTQEMKVSGLAAGLYIVTIQTLTESYSKKLIVQ
jgi:hypothetical protein